MPRLRRGTEMAANRRGWRGAVLVCALLLAHPWPPALAQATSTSYEIPRQTIDGGAARAASASYSVDATLGQADAQQPMSSSNFQVRGGFHRPAQPLGPLPDDVFADGFEGP